MSGTIRITAVSALVLALACGAEPHVESESERELGAARGETKVSDLDSLRGALQVLVEGVDRELEALEEGVVVSRRGLDARSAEARSTADRLLAALQARLQSVRSEIRELGERADGGLVAASERLREEIERLRGELAAGRSQRE